MKKLFLLFALGAGLMLSNATFAQVTIRFNIERQPIWGPVGYDYVEYYYLPEIESYYYVPGRRFIYFENGYWKSRSNLPSRYREFNMYNSRKVVMNERKPYLHHQDNRARFNSNDRENQQSIRDSRETKYYVNKNHPEHNNWRNTRKQENRKHNRR